MQRENPAISAFKVWVFPSLVSIVSLMIWNDVNEIKADVKALMAQSAIDKTRIDNLERQVYGSKAKFSSIPEGSKDEPVQNFHQTTYAVLPNNEVKYKNSKKI